MAGTISEDMDTPLSDVFVDDAKAAGIQVLLEKRNLCSNPGEICVVVVVVSYI